MARTLLLVEVVLLRDRQRNGGLLGRVGVQRRHLLVEILVDLGLN
jgi:hypothetical protein